MRRLLLVGRLFEELRGALRPRPPAVLFDLTHQVGRRDAVDVGQLEQRLEAACFATTPRAIRRRRLRIWRSLRSS